MSDFERLFPNAAPFTVHATIGPRTSWPQQRMRKTFGAGNFHAVVPCPGKCHGGGFDLGYELAGRLRQGAAGVKGTIGCKGYQAMGRHRRQACDYTLEYEIR